MQNLHNLQSITSHIFPFFQQFLPKFLCQLATLKPNMLVYFSILNITKISLIYSLSLFIFLAWGILLHHYPGSLYLLLLLILQFVYYLRYTGPSTQTSSKKLVSILLNLQIITKKLKDNLLSSWVILVT